MAVILCVDDQPSTGIIFEHTLSKIGHRPLLVSSVADALETITRTPVDLIVADFVVARGRGRRNAIDLLEMTNKEAHRVPVIIMTGCSNVADAVVAIKGGAISHLVKPIHPETLEMAVNQALEVVRLGRENEALRVEIATLRSTTDGPLFNLDELERRTIDRALAATGGNRTRAAKLLGISERTLRNKLNTPKVPTSGS
jgi:DNA-binding NtrC family response regulator